MVTAFLLCLCCGFGRPAFFELLKFQPPQEFLIIVGAFNQRFHFVV